MRLPCELRVRGQSGSTVAPKQLATARQEGLARRAMKRRSWFRVHHGHEVPSGCGELRSEGAGLGYTVVCRRSRRRGRRAARQPCRTVSSTHQLRMSPVARCSARCALVAGQSMGLLGRVYGSMAHYPYSNRRPISAGRLGALRAGRKRPTTAPARRTLGGMALAARDSEGDGSEADAAADEILQECTDEAELSDVSHGQTDAPMPTAIPLPGGAHRHKRAAKPRRAVHDADPAGFSMQPCPTCSLWGYHACPVDAPTLQRRQQQARMGSVCVRVCVSMGVCVCACVCECVHACVSVCVCVLRARVCMYACVCVGVRARVYMCLRACERARVRVYLYPRA
jgi:hypothetical protein